MGKFSIFKDALLVAHLGIRDSHSVQHFESSHARWVTILKNSPALKIVADSTHHFKLCTVNASLENLVISSPVTASNSSRNTIGPSPAKIVESGDAKVKAMVELIDGGDVFGGGSDGGNNAFTSKVVDLSSLVDDDEIYLIPPSPTPKRRQTRSPSIPYISLPSTRFTPTQLLEFPPAGALAMDIRMRWISDNEGSGSLSKRFSSVFSCSFKSSTFHKHWAAWKWLRENGELENLGKDCLWKTLADKVPYGKDEKRRSGVNSNLERCEVEHVY